ncbi:hypothetical protein ACFX13_035388 [Malus domestica]
MIQIAASTFPFRTPQPPSDSQSHRAFLAPPYFFSTPSACPGLSLLRQSFVVCKMRLRTSSVSRRSRKISSETAAPTL